MFRDEVHAKNAYEKLKRKRVPKSAVEMFDAWVEDVERRGAEQRKAWPEPLRHQRCESGPELDPTDIDPDWGNTDVPAINPPPEVTPGALS